LVKKRFLDEKVPDTFSPPPHQGRRGQANGDTRLSAMSAVFSGPSTEHGAFMVLAALATFTMLAAIAVAPSLSAVPRLVVIVAVVVGLLGVEVLSLADLPSLAANRGQAAEQG
jgi:hypothetical protein